MSRTHPVVAALVADLHRQFARSVESAYEQGRAHALTEIRSLVGDVAPVKTGPGRPLGSTNHTKSGDPTTTPAVRKNAWSGLTPEARLARVNAIRRGKGLPPRTE